MEINVNGRQKLLLIVALSVVGLFAADHIVFSPLIELWKSRAERVTTLRNQISRGKQLQVRGLGLRNHWADMQRNALTNNISAAEQQVFRAIDNWAQDTGVVVGAITPQWKRDMEGYATYECRVEASGDLSRLSQFLYRAEREPLALRLESIELAARDKTGQQLTLGLQLGGLVLNPPPP